MICDVALNNLSKSTGSNSGSRPSCIATPVGFFIEDIIMPNKGYKHTKEAKEKMSRSHKGKKLSVETREKMRVRMLGNKYCLGKKLSEEHRKNLSDALKGRKGKKHSEESKEKNRQAHLGNTYRLGFKCSLQRRQQMSKTHSGENSPFWKGGISKKSARIRRSLEYRLWKEAVLDRDNHTCQDCDGKEKLHAHHIKGFNEYPELRFDVDNGKTTCNKCHPKLHASKGEGAMQQ